MSARLPAAGGGGGGGGFGGGVDNTPAEFKSGFGAEGVKALQAFVQNGGTLLTFANAGDLAIQRFGLPLRNVVAGVKPQRSSGLPARRLKVTFDNTNPLGGGMPSPKAWRSSWPVVRSTR